MKAHIHRCFLLLCLLSFLQLRSQVLPKEGTALHYRLVGFVFPVTKQATRYTLEIAAGNCNTNADFKKKKIRSVSCKKNKTIAEVPLFGSQYTWRVIYTGNNAAATTSELHHFSTAMSPYVDTNLTRLRIIKPAVKYKDDYLFLDGNKALYDMSGNPVWYLPETDDSLNTNGLISDLRLSPQGAITFLLKDKAYEINYNGRILWEAPDNGSVSGDRTEHYHHEFTRLANGHYMILGNERKQYDGNISSSQDTVSHVAPGNRIKENKDFFHPKTEFGTIIEYDQKGDVVWSWKSSAYFLSSDLDYYRLPPHTRIIDVHENSFFFDEKKSVIYLSFRNLSRIIKIKYPEGTVLNTYGEIYMPGVAEKGNGLFCNQHSPRISQDGYLYLFNNNFCSTAPPSVLMMQETTAGKDSLKKIWEYTCPVDGNYPAKFASGGNAIELPDRSVFVCMGSQYSRLLIVNRDKKILWSAIPEQRHQAGGRWNIIHQYKACIIDRKDLERLIWNAETEN